MSLKVGRLTPPCIASETLAPTPVARSLAVPLAPLAGATVNNVLGRTPQEAGSSAVAVRCVAEPATALRRGRVVRLFDQFYSHVLDNKRDVYVYLPPSYDPSRAADFPIIYMHDGQNLFDPGRGFNHGCWHVDQALDAGLNAGLLPEAIVVAIDNTPDRIFEMTPSDDGKRRSGGSAKYLQFIAKELMPEVERWLNVRHTRDKTAIIGSSLGGLTSLSAALSYPKVFGRIGAVSPSSGWNDKEILHTIRGLASGPAPFKLWLDSGDQGDSKDGMAETAELAEVIRSLRLPTDFSHKIYAGAGHNEGSWQKRILDVLRFLLGDLAEPTRG